MNVLTFQVTTEKVKALMELAQLKQDYQLLQEYDSLFLFPLNYQFDLMLCKFHVGANIFFLIYLYIFHPPALCLLMNGRLRSLLIILFLWSFKRSLILGFLSNGLSKVPLIRPLHGGRKIFNEMKEEKVLAGNGEKRIVIPERDGRLRNLLKKTNLRRWIGTLDFSGNDGQADLNTREGFSTRRSNSIDFARLVKQLLIFLWFAETLYSFHIHA